MTQKPSHLALGADLRAARRKARLTQMDLATRARLSMPTVRQAEMGAGILATTVALAAFLNLEVTGRSLPPGEGMGARLAELRRHRGVSLRLAAGLSGISPISVASLECGEAVHVGTAARVADTLGVRLRLSPPGAEEFWTTVAA